MDEMDDCPDSPRIILVACCGEIFRIKMPPPDALTPEWLNVVGETWKCPRCGQRIDE